MIWLYRDLHARVDVSILRLSRLMLGGVSLLWVCSNWPHLERDYGLDGMMQLSRIQNPSLAWTLVELLPGHHLSLFVLGLTFSLLFLVAPGTRLWSFALWAYHSWLVTLNPYAMNSEQYMFLWLFLYGTAVPWRQMASESGWFYSKSVRLIQLQVCLVYLISTFWKIELDPGWIRGETVFFVLNHSLWSKVAGQEWIRIPAMAPLLTYSSLLLEGAFPFLVWKKNLRLALVLCLFGFHLSLSVILMKHIGFFSMAMMTSLLFWLRASDFRRLSFIKLK